MEAYHAAASAGGGGLRSSQLRPLPQRRQWQCMHQQRGILVHPASMEEILEEDEHPLARFGCSDAPSSHAAFGDHGVDYQQDSKMSFLCIDHVRDSKEGTLGQLGRASL